MLCHKINVVRRRVEDEPLYRQIIEKETSRLQHHYKNPIHQLRVVLMGSAHHHNGSYEVHLFAHLAGNIIAVMKKGDHLPYIIYYAFHVLDAQLVRQLKTRRDESRHEEKYAGGAAALP